MEIIDTYTEALGCYDESGYSYERWKEYIDSSVPGLFPILSEDAKSALNADGASEEELLRVLNGMIKNREQLNAAHDSFSYVAKNLDGTIRGRFGKGLDAVVVFLSRALQRRRLGDGVPRENGDTFGHGKNYRA